MLLLGPRDFIAEVCAADVDVAFERVGSHSKQVWFMGSAVHAASRLTTSTPGFRHILHLHLHLGHLADAFIQSDLQRVHLLK